MANDLICTRATPRQATSAAAFAAAPPAEGDPLLDFEPAPHVAARRNSITADKQRKFIATLAATGIVTHAARAIGASTEALYTLRHKPGAEGFRAAWEAALDRGVARLEDCAMQLALEGEERMVVSAGQLIGTERRHNTALLIFLLRQRLPHRYGSDIHPGHPVYERIRAEVQAEIEAQEAIDEDAVLASLDAKIAAQRARQEAAARLLAQAGEDIEDAEWEDR